MAPARIVRFVRLAEGRTKVELFHLRRDRVDYFVVLRSGTSLSYGIEATGSSAEVARAFDLELDNLLKGTRLFSGKPEIVADKPDAEARKSVKAFDHPMFGLDWGKEPEAKGGDPEAEDFYKLLKRQVDEWKGGRHSLPLVRHRYWPTFRKMVAEAVTKKWGARFDLFRGVYGDQALKILDEGAPLDVYRFSSWTIDRSVAKDFALDPHGRTGKHFWIVVKAPFKATDVVFAPVVLPDFTLNPRILKERFTWETEFVVDAKAKRLKPGQFKVVERTRAKRGAKNPYLNTPPTVLVRKIHKEINPMKRKLMNDALNAWRMTQGNPLARSAARVATRWLACGGT